LVLIDYIRPKKEIFTWPKYKTEKKAYLHFYNTKKRKRQVNKLFSTIIEFFEVLPLLTFT